MIMMIEIMSSSSSSSNSSSSSSSSSCCMRTRAYQLGPRPPEARCSAVETVCAPAGSFHFRFFRPTLGDLSRGVDGGPRCAAAMLVCVCVSVCVSVVRIFVYVLVCGRRHLSRSEREHKPKSTGKSLCSVLTFV